MSLSSAGHHTCKRASYFFRTFPGRLGRVSFRILPWNSLGIIVQFPDKRHLSSEESSVLLLNYGFNSGLTSSDAEGHLVVVRSSTFDIPGSCRVSRRTAFAVIGNWFT